MRKKSNKNFDPNKSLTKLIVYFKDGGKRTFHSDTRKDKSEGRVATAIDLANRLNERWKYVANTTLLCDNVTGAELEKWYQGKLRVSSLRPVTNN